jgi:hypothetical protein
MTSTNWDVAQDIGLIIQHKVSDSTLRFSILLQQMGRSLRSLVQKGIDKCISHGMHSTNIQIFPRRNAILLLATRGHSLPISLTFGTHLFSIFH